MGLGGFGGAGLEAPPNVTEGAGQAPPPTGCLRPYSSVGISVGRRPLSCSPIGASKGSGHGSGARLEAASGPGCTRRLAHALPRPTRGRPATQKRLALARCKVSSAPGERLLRRLAGGALEAAPVPPRHPGEPHPGQLPAERTLGSQVPSQSRCCTHRRLLRTLHLSTGAEQGGRDARSVHRPQHGSRAHALPSRARPRAHSHMRSAAHTLVPPPPRSMHSLTQRPASAPRRRLSSPRMPGRAAARRHSASTRRQRSHHAELDSACGAVSPLFEMFFF